MTEHFSKAAAGTNDDYPKDELIEQSQATIKPGDDVICARCPNSEWIEESEHKYATASLRAYCVGLGGQWVWPNRRVTGCSARRKAIRAERKP